MKTRRYSVYKMLIGLLGIAVLFGIEKKLNADAVIFSNPWHEMESNGYSEAFSTGGAQPYPKQSLAQRFVTTQSYDLHSVRWWGAMNTAWADIDPNWIGPEENQPNLKGFQIVIWNHNFTQKIHNQTFMLNQMESVRMPGAPGEYNEYTNLNNREYTYYATFENAASIAAGTYHLNIGALYHNYGFAGNYNYNGVDYPMMHDSWIWTAGEQSISNPNSLYATLNRPDIGYQWGNWINDFGFGSLNTVGGASFLYAPTPGAIALLGLSGLIGNRRRR